MRVLGIETSCDETSVAIVTENRQILSNVIFSQLSEHQAFGGVVPEIGARTHLTYLQSILVQALNEAKLTLSDMDAIAATSGPGLIGGVIVGCTFAKAIALSQNKPFIAVNHLEAHALTPRLTNDVSFPYLLLLMSGGHTELILVKGIGIYQKLGSTIDDAVGEAFDKTARLLGLPYPGGPSLEQAARLGNPDLYPFPKPLCNKPGMDFSFSGLKTAVRVFVQKQEALSSQDTADIAASFQKTVADILVNRCGHALNNTSVETLVIAGGVAANTYIREHLVNLCNARNVTFVAPPPKLCTDNGAMVAWAGLERFRLGFVNSLDFAPRPRWPLAEI